ncbi:hypothetical protein WEB32_01135 [Streptomyces netropsis]|uniref:trypsin-like serine peptidase n=1 Tax=Streptomyces netropsis TaxID=55404 RepID=UPI0030CADDD8
MRGLVSAFIAGALVVGAVQQVPAPAADRGGVNRAAFPVGYELSVPGAMPQPGLRVALGQEPVTARADAAPKASVNPGPNVRMGRLYMHTPELEACAAALVPSKHHNLVITAAHCLHAGGGGKEKYYKDFTFVPGHRKGQAPPYGVFAGKQPMVNYAYAAKGDLRYDYGFLILHPGKDGRQAGEVVGENDFMVNAPFVASRTLWSYLYHDSPAECFGQTRPFLFPPESRIQVDCRFEPTSSGGPWYDGYDAATQKGTVNGVISGPPDKNAPSILSPYFDDFTWLLYKESDNDG